MKLRIELSCVEDDLTTALYEAKRIIEATDIVHCEIKVFLDRNREPKAGHRYVSMSKDSNVNDLLQIWELKKKLEELSTYCLTPTTTL